MLEFHLVYQGLLPSAGNKPHSREKHFIRRYLHKQLVNAWNTKYPLKARQEVFSRSDKPTHDPVIWKGLDTSQDEFIKHLNGKRYLPIVIESLALVCKLNILLLSMGSNVMDTGDLDGRVKTILDALKMPKRDDYAEGDEDPLFCLLEDDKSISDLRVTADLLMAPPEQVMGKNIFGEFQENPQHAFVLNQRRC